MNKGEFISKILLRHAISLTPEAMKIYQEDYTTSLDDRIDFDLLFQTYLEEYNFNVVPKPAWFKQRAKFKQKPIINKPEIRSLYIRLPSGNTYEFAYEYPQVSEFEARKAVLERFSNRILQAKEEGKDYKVEFIPQSDFRGF